jgi:hypothetical protein
MGPKNVPCEGDLKWKQSTDKMGHKLTKEHQQNFYHLNALERDQWMIIIDMTSNDEVGVPRGPYLAT